MKIIIIGAGEVGRHLCDILSEDNHDVTVIETDEKIGTEVDEQFNVRVLSGNGSSAHVLQNAGVQKCQLFLAMTSDDGTNILSSSIAKAMGAEVTVARIHDRTYNESEILNYQKHFGIDHLLNPEALTAVELAKAIRHPGRVAVEYFARGKIEVQQLALNARSKLVGRPLKDLRLDPGIRIGFVYSEDRQEVANAETILREGDMVTVFGSAEILDQTRRLFRPELDNQRVTIVLYGGGDTAISLVRLLSHPRFRIRILEPDPHRCEQLAELFPQVTIIQGNATSLRLLEEEQVGSADYFVACTKNDEDNIMTCIQASKLGAKHCLLLINRADYLQVIDRLKETLGLELVVSPRLATANQVKRYANRKPYFVLANLPGESGQILEIRVQKKSSVVGMKLRDIKWAGPCVVAALLRGHEVKVPGAEDEVCFGDRLVLIASDEHAKEAVRLLAP
ncbi:MAG: Trk system potassium transporter TrkA [Opitutales bacterium]|nr:Trk system potassium transporter TrkA [Opitutales bacterium]MCH8541620.1 Trk system potassium transporter TrkA [Opitutales bacterium]